MGEARFRNRLVVVSSTGAATLLCMNEGLSTRARILLCFDLTEKSHGVVNDVAQDHVMLYFHCRRTLLSKWWLPSLLFVGARDWSLFIILGGLSLILRRFIGIASHSFHVLDSRNLRLSPVHLIGLRSRIISFVSFFQYWSVVSLHPLERVTFFMTWLLCWMKTSDTDSRRFGNVPFFHFI